MKILGFEILNSHNIQTYLFISIYLKNLQTEHKSNFSDKTNIENIKVNANIATFHCFSNEGYR